MTSIYTYSCREEELSLCKLEQRSFFGFDTDARNVESSLKIDPSRSPFIKERVDVIYEGIDLKDIIKKMEGFEFHQSTFKVIYVKNNDQSKSEQADFDERRRVARKIGLHINGKPDLESPEALFGIMHVNGRFVFGSYKKNEAIWLHHQKKPQSYSTALSTRVARAVVNIAIPDPRGIKAIDPCCGIGTVLVEARSMGIDMVGSDLNYLVIPGVLENLAYFGLECEVKQRHIRDVLKTYDAAIIDMPYNLCSVITEEEQLEMIQSARRFTRRLVVITIEPIDSILHTAGFTIVDRCNVKKGTFIRQVIVCE
ncbi:RNA methyltransferase [bacterium LRH843]|nr:RNA methyltransferase [bacterium LRH843]